MLILVMIGFDVLAFCKFVRSYNWLSYLCPCVGIFSREPDIQPRGN